MKKIIILSLVLISFMIGACSESSVDPSGNPSASNDNYYPLAIGNYWVYHFDGLHGFPADTNRIDIIATVIDQGNTWYQFSSDQSSGYAYLRYLGDNLLDASGRTTLKKVLVKGESWSYSRYENGVYVYDTVRVWDVGMERTVSGTEYSNVAKVSMINVMTDGIDGVRNEYIYYYAKGIGMIESLSPLGRSVYLIDYHIEN